MAKPVIAKKETAYWAEASDATNGWASAMRLHGFDEQAEVGLKGGQHRAHGATATDSGAFARNDRIEYDRHASASTMVSRMAGGRCVRGSWSVVMVVTVPRGWREVRKGKRT